VTVEVWKFALLVAVIAVVAVSAEHGQWLELGVIVAGVLSAVRDGFVQRDAIRKRP
jgi:hypothetical protein